MKYSAALLLALFGLTAASFLPHQEDAWDRVRDKKHHTVDHMKHDIHGNHHEDFFNEYTKYGSIENMDNTDRYQQNGDKIFLLKQKTVLQLLSNLQQKNMYLHLTQMGDRFNPLERLNKFNNVVAVKKFLMNYENNNFLKVDEVFVPTVQHHQNQAAQLFTFLYSAQDWETLMHAAAWARDRFNGDQFAYVFTAVVLNHPTTQGVVIPALYEILPHVFVPATALKKIYRAKFYGLNQYTVKVNYTNQNQNNFNFNNEYFNFDKSYNVDTEKNVWGTHNPNNIFADNDGSLYNNAGTAENPENKLSYFTEDIGINDIHARFHMQYPIFFGENNNKNYYTSNMETINRETMNNDNKYDIRRGEAFYFAHQQLFARYVLERLSNNLPIPHPINLNGMIETGFNPNLQYGNGQAFPVRPPRTMFWQQFVEESNDNINALLPNNNQAQKPQVYERRIQDVADSGYVLNMDGTKTKLTKNNAFGILANLIAAPASSLNPDYYGDYFSSAKNAIGNIVDPNNQNEIAPGAVAGYATAARDPAYYQLLAKMNLIFKNLQNKLGPYTKSELIFPGVKIEKMDVSNLVTYFDTVKVNVNNMVPRVNIKHTENQGMNSELDYNVKFQRLTNKPYTVKLVIKSEKNTDAIVRFFLGPKYDSNGQLFTLPQASQYFVQLDQFRVRLTTGENLIERHSQETNVNVQDPPSFQKLWNRLETALQGQKPFFYNKAEHQVLGLPIRAQLPKGKRNGQQFVLYAIVNSFENTYYNDMNINMDVNMDMNTEHDMEFNKKHMDMNTEHNKEFNKKHFDIEDEFTKDFKMTGNRNMMFNFRDNRSIGFPLDRPVVDVNYNTANQYFKTVTIYHNVSNDK